MRQRIRPLAVVLCGAALLVGCSTPATRVVLLPQPEGTPSAVVVRANGGEETLSRPYQRATAARGAAGAPVVDQVDPARLRAENPTLFDLLPAEARRSVVFFDANGTVLAESSQLVMTEALRVALARNGSDIVITGHTDTRGTEAQNDDLSRRRAQQVRQMFIERDFPSARIEAVGRGERDLAVPTADEVDEPRNRRVTIEVR